MTLVQGLASPLTIVEEAPATRRILIQPLLALPLSPPILPSLEEPLRLPFPVQRRG